MTPDRSQKILSSRLKLHVNEWGDPAAPPLVLQHGGRDQSRSWDGVIDAFVDDHRIIAADMRGHGDSEWDSDGSYMTIDYVYDFATIMDVLKLPPCPIIGHSLGGNIVTRYTGLYPDRVTRLINIEGLGFDSGHYGPTPDEAGRLRKWVASKRRMSSWAPAVYDNVGVVAGKLIENDPLLKPDLALRIAGQSVHQNENGTVTLKYDPALFATPPIDISNDALLQIWGAIRCPMLIVYGRQSFAPDPISDSRAQYFPHARIELFDDAGHWVHYHQQDAFIALAKDFLAG